MPHSAKSTAARDIELPVGLISDMGNGPVVVGAIGCVEADLLTRLVVPSSSPVAISFTFLLEDEVRIRLITCPML